MNELNPDVAAALRHYACVDVPRDWDDVLHRAGTRRRVRPQLAAAAIEIGRAHV